MRAISPPLQRPETPRPPLQRPAPSLHSARLGGSVGDFIDLVDKSALPPPPPIVSGSSTIFLNCLNKVGASAIMVLVMASIFDTPLSMPRYNLKPIPLSIALAGVILFVNLCVRGYFDPLPAKPDFAQRIARQKEHLENATRNTHPDKEKIQRLEIQRLVADYKRIHTTEWSYHAQPLRQIYAHEIQQLENSITGALDQEKYESFIKQKLKKIPAYRLAQDQLAIATERLDAVINTPGYPHLLTELYNYDMACGNINKFLIETYKEWDDKRSKSLHFT